jgi:L1 cell adhesion molecule like protein
VKASDGDNKLGGADFDNKLTHYISEKFIAKHSPITLDNTATRRLHHQCEIVKRHLTDSQFFDLEILEFVGKISLHQTITRDQFESVNDELFTRAMKPVTDCLSSANMTVEDIDEVVLVGGSSRIPKIQKMLKEHFNGKELNNSINPDEAIAYGAAIQAAICTDQYKNEVLSIQDIIPVSLATSITGNKLSIIIPKNTAIPCSITKPYYTTKDNQTNMRVQVYQGENTIDKYKNIYIGEFELENLKQGLAGKVKVDITFAIDADGILEVTTQEESAGKKTIKIDRSRV